MKEGQDKWSCASDLRRNAEARLIEKRQGRCGAGVDQTSAADPQRLIQELQIYQIELEMQNEELKKSRDQAEAERQRYSDLYDFAPVGYFTLDSDGVIRRANFAGARLLGLDHSLLPNRRFGYFVSEADRPAFDDFLKKVFGGRFKKRCNVTLGQEGHQRLHVHIEAAVTRDGQECRAAVLDMTRRKNAEEKLRKLQLEQRAAGRSAPPEAAGEEMRSSYGA